MSCDYVVTEDWSMKRRKDKNDKKRELRRPGSQQGLNKNKKTSWGYKENQVWLERSNHPNFIRLKPYTHCYCNSSKDMLWNFSIYIQRSPCRGKYAVLLHMKLLAKCTQPLLYALIMRTFFSLLISCIGCLG